MELDDIVIILCRPSEPGNAGAVCRAMKNSGLSGLRLVAPVNMDETLVRTRAVHAEDIWDNAQTYNTLAEAIADCSLVIGTSRRRGKRRKLVSMLPRETALFLKNFPAGKNCPAALVFGNERTGLENDELALCSFSSHIPANDVFPSLNLSHSVQIYGYELRLALCSAAETASCKGYRQPVPRSEIDALCTSICNSLASLGFYTHTNRHLQEEFFCDVFSRAGLSPFETQYMRDIFAKASRLGQKTSGAVIQDTSVKDS